MDDELMSATDHAMRYMLAAVREFGTAAWSPRPSDESDQPEAFGRDLFQLIFADRTRWDKLDDQLVALAHNPDDAAAQSVLDSLMSDAIQDDEVVAPVLLEKLTAFYQQHGQSGNAQAFIDLGDLLYWEGDFDDTKAAYQQAIDAGRPEALIGMAYLYRRAGDDDAARTCLDQAIRIGDPDLTARALETLGTVLWSSDPAGAESALLRAVDTGHRDRAPAAMSQLADLRAQRGDARGARAAHWQAINTGHPEWANRSRYELGRMLEEEGDRAGARKQYWRLIEIGHKHWGQDGLLSLIPLLQDDGDLDGLRELHRTAVEIGYWSAPEVLVTIGFLLEQRGDADAARVTFQQAIDDGLDGPDWLIEKLHPSPKPTAAELDALPAQFDPRTMVLTGIEVLRHGLPDLPDQLSYLMAIPVAYWTAAHSAVVLFLKFQRQGRRHESLVLHVTYSREDDGWTANSRYIIGMNYDHDPIANPASLRELDGSAMVTGGGSETQLHGRASPAVKYIALIQDGREDLRRLESHFGAWVVSTERLSPFHVEGRDADGNVLARISHDPDEYLRRPPLGGGEQ